MFSLKTESWTLYNNVLSRFVPPKAIVTNGNIYLFSGVTYMFDTGDYYFDKVCIFSPEKERIESKGDAMSYDLKEYSTVWITGYRVNGICELFFHKP